jgi:methionyl-tRNA formyltransferase
VGDTSIKIVVLTSATPGNVYLVNRLLARHDVVAMVIESPPRALTLGEKRRRRLKLLKRHGPLRTLNKLLYNVYRARFLSTAEARAFGERFFPNGQPATYERRVPTLTVTNINDPACIAFVREHAPTVIAVCGTTVIKPEVFTLASLGAVNIHMGITPEYRSADPVFWALYNRELNKVGVTIHFVDSGIDTGPILRQAAVPLYAEDTLPIIKARCIQYGAELYLEALDDVESGNVRIVQRPGVTGRAFYSINLGVIQYLVFCWRFSQLKRSLPNSPAIPTSLERSSS